MPYMLNPWSLLPLVWGESEFLTRGSGTPLRSDLTDVLWAPRKASNDPFIPVPTLQVYLKGRHHHSLSRRGHGGTGKGGAWAMGTVIKLVVL